ncbi:MAG: hypothetical protein DRJ03_00035 [Chloroflexi bacterium]|nr:MAG: hypothetical protein DRJ03_00035 [Chloroflexota bacterium]
MEQCEFPRCRGYAEFGYIGRDVCASHWSQLCDADSKTEKKLLKKIGLVRDKSGAVVPITPAEKD